MEKNGEIESSFLSSYPSYDLLYECRLICHKIFLSLHFWNHWEPCKRFTDFW